MKFRRFLSGLLFGLGCATAFIGLLAVVLPSIQNPQLQLVLSSFELEASHPLVNLINRWMRFSLQQNWRMLYLGILIAGAGAWLLLHFTPAKPWHHRQAISHTPQTEEWHPAEESNPFAVDCYNVQLHEKKLPETVSAFLHSEPILDRNPIAESEESGVPLQPFLSSRLAAEARAIETAVDSGSQSGNRMMIRAAYHPDRITASADGEPPAEASCTK